jgi:hydroxymethylglutaryl-CoA lyase
MTSFFSASSPLPAHAVIREVGLRDGLQSLARVMPTAQKIEWIAAAYEAGQREIEVGSFVPPRLMPQLADTAEVLAFANTLPGLMASVLVPNLKGAERAIDCGANSMLVPLSASRSHSLANLRKTPDEVVSEIARIVALRDASASRTRIEVGLSTAFGCTIQGRVEPAEVLRLLESVLDAGVDSVGLADTVGYADPAMVRSLFDAALPLARGKLNCGHFHDTRGLGLANVYAALQAGVTRFDACLAGLGGCPLAPGASGNVSTEDLAYMLASMHIGTGLDLDALLALRQRLAGWLEGEQLHGTLWKAGLPGTLAPVRAEPVEAAVSSGGNASTSSGRTDFAAAR